MIKNTLLIRQIVEEMGGTFEEVIPERSCYYIHVRGKNFLITRKFRIAKNFISIAGATGYKDLTYTLLRRQSLPTPTTVFFFRKNFKPEDVEKKLINIKFPIIIKDSAGSNSRGIFPYIKNLAEAQYIIKKEILNFRSLIAQEMIFGKEYRVLILDNKVIGALEMIPPRIVGDGKSTITQLIAEKQKHTRRKTPLDQALIRILTEQGFSLNSVLNDGETVSIKKSSSLAEGGETQDATNLVNKEIASICVKAADTVGYYLAGIDIICENISADPATQTFRIVIKVIINFILKLKTTVSDPE
jgi:cyanophycin synthetase